MTQSEKIQQAVARGWCAPENAHKEMDTELASAIAAEVEHVVNEYVEALQWCSGASDFAPEGKARAGFEKVVLPLLKEDS